MLSNPPPKPLVPKLRTLHLAANPFFISRLVNALNPPLTTITTNLWCKSDKLEVAHDTDHTGYVEFAWILTWVSGRIKRLEEVCTPLRVLHVRSQYGDENSDSDDSFTLRFSPFPFPFDSTSPSQVPKPPLELKSGAGSFDYFQESLFRITPYLPLSKIEYLFLDHIVSMDEPQHVFGEMTSVHTLYISGDETMALLFVLTLWPDLEDEDGDNPDNEAATQLSLLPAVRTVVLHDALLEKWSFTLEFFESRAKCGCAIQTFRISECRSISPVFLQRLRRNVPVVELDGQGEMDLS